MISIIALLIGLLLPALTAAREAGRDVVCRSNLRQMGIATTLFIDTSQGLFPYGQMSESRGAAFDGNWATLMVNDDLLAAVKPTVSGTVETDSVFYCPSGGPKVGNEGEFGANGGREQRSNRDGTEWFLDIWYGVNANTGDRGSSQGWPMVGVGPSGWMSMDRYLKTNTDSVQKPSDLIMYYDGFWMHNVSNSLTRTMPRHAGGKNTNMLIFDGHVESVNTADVTADMWRHSDSASAAQLPIYRSVNGW